MRSQLPLLSSHRLILRMANHEDIQRIISYFSHNKTYLTPYYPLWEDGFFSEEYWRLQVETNLHELVNDRSLRLFMFPKENLDIIIGTINFNNFVRGAAQYCHVGYSLAQTWQGQGYMVEGLSLAVNYVFQQLKMHRIMACYMPHNQRSGNLLKKLGFVVEGYARDYLLINGKWEDHILTSLINPHYPN